MKNVQNDPLTRCPLLSNPLEKEEEHNEAVSTMCPLKG